jgi:hypothetical protein
MRRARTWGWRRTRRYDEPSSDLAHHTNLVRIASSLRVDMIFGKVGAIYIWRSRAEAEAVYAGEWLQRVQRHYGVEPEIIWFESSFIVDNVSRQMIKA